MSALSIRLKRFFRRMLSEDIKIIAIFLLLILTIMNAYALTLGWLSAAGLGFNTPSIGLKVRAEMPDSDGDLLPDLVETTPKGQPVIWNGQKVGEGTGTDPNKKDTDGDLFTDGAEDNLGSDPNNWFNPGYLWILWVIAIGYIIYVKYREEDLLKEYKEFESLEGSGSVAEGKFAYSGSTIFSKRTSGMTEEEKKKVIQSDARFHKLTGEAQDQPKEVRKYKPKRLIVQFLIVLFIILVFRFISTQ